MKSPVFLSVTSHHDFNSFWLRVGVLGKGRGTISFTRCWRVVLSLWPLKAKMYFSIKHFFFISDFWKSSRTSNLSPSPTIQLYIYVYIYFVLYRINFSTPVSRLWVCGMLFISMKRTQGKNKLLILLMHVKRKTP